MAAIQSSVDQLIKEHFAKQMQMEGIQLEEDRKPQPFTQETLVKFFIDEFNNTHDVNMPKEERDKCALNIALEIKRLLGMTNGEIKSYFSNLDKERTMAAMRSNERTIFEFCLIREMSSMKNLVGKEREEFRASRIKAYEAGTFDYSKDEKRSEEILISMEDKHFPDSNKKLKPICFSTYEELLNKQEEAKKKMKK